MNESNDALQHLNEEERACLHRFVELLKDRLGDNLHEVWLFGSAVRGDMWPSSFTILSDIDLLVLTHEPLSERVNDDLLNETYPLYLECGRQIAPQWRTKAWFANRQDERAEAFKAEVKADGQALA